MKLTLKKPITVGETTVTELTFREEVVAGDLRDISLTRIPELQTGDVLKLAGRLTGQTDLVMAKLSFADLIEVTGVVSGFLFGGPQTGPK